MDPEAVVVKEVVLVAGSITSDGCDALRRKVIRSAFWPVHLCRTAT